MGIGVIGGTSGLVAEVEGASSKALRVLLYDAAGNAIVVADKSTKQTTQYGIPNIGLDDETLRLLRADPYGTLRTSDESLLLRESCEGSTLNTQRWTSTATTMTAAQGVLAITLNSSAITTINTGIILSSQKAYHVTLGAPLRYQARARFTTVANQSWELGFGQQGTLSGTAIIDNGAHWRFNTSGDIVPVLAFNGTEITGTNISGSVSNANYYNWIVILADDRAVFQCQRTDTGAIVSEQTLRLPITQSRMFAVTHINAIQRLRNSGSAPASAGQLLIGDVEVVRLDLDTRKEWSHVLAGNAQGGEVSPTAITQTAQWANSADPANATLSNTTASYSTLGGLFSIAAAASAATDYTLFSLAVPAPYSFVCTGLKVSMWNTGAANAATPASTLAWGIGANGASANLSTGGHLRVFGGHTTIPASAAIGADGGQFDVNFDAPLRTEPGKHITVIAKIVGGAATASQVWRGAVAVKGYFE